MHSADRVNDILDRLGFGPGVCDDGLIASIRGTELYLTDGYGSGLYRKEQLVSLLEGLLASGKAVSLEDLWWGISPAEINEFGPQTGDEYVAEISDYLYHLGADEIVCTNDDTSECVILLSNGVRTGRYYSDQVLRVLMLEHLAYNQVPCEQVWEAIACCAV